MPLIILGLILVISILIYTFIKNRKEIHEAGDKFAERLYSVYKKFIDNMNKSSTTFTTDEDSEGEEKEEDKVIFFPNKDKNTED